MSYWSGQNVLLGITASIAAYKSAHLLRELIKAGANVKVIQTPASKEFVTPLTLSTLSKNPVLIDFTQDENEEVWNNHVDLGLWADCMIVAPATAKTLSKMVSGESDNLLLATYLSARCPVFFAPAMDLDMYAHPSTQENIQKLLEFGNFFIPPGEGELASGLSGKGRMAEPEEIVEFVAEQLFNNLPLSGKQVMITAGPTFESIDPVRFIGNYSSGKMGFSIALEAAKKGAQIKLISGPTSQEVTHPLISRVNVTSAQEMLDACLSHFKQSDITIMSAAVADYRPKQVASKKVKKSDDNLYIDLEPTIDILKTLGNQKSSKQFLCGFALESENEESNAQGKLIKKNLDMIVLNSLQDKGAGFNHDTNKISILDKNNKFHRFELKSKVEAAQDIIDFIITQV
ncbi:MAG: bifunctional phosphopantothenoylcysteine decarboxylase/phosphopantothenate--cysteine ligase CoaBC [Flavobacteriales bacterium]|nr:bifunctional phosphopantothenoylcysteine decarboxylase/phosphopantothenate--cysteine ligase CoaBC [Flavobacteriales bacterium]